MSWAAAVQDSNMSGTEVILHLLLQMSLFSG